MPVSALLCLFVKSFVSIALFSNLNYGVIFNVERYTRRFVRRYKHGAYLLILFLVFVDILLRRKSFTPW